MVLGKSLITASFLVISLCGGLLGEERDAAEATLRTASSPHMGTIVRIVADCDDAEQFMEATRAAFRRIEEIEQICSDYRPDSEILQLSAKSPTKSPVRVSDELWQVLQRAKAVHAASGGAFDPTVGPLTKEWRRFRRRKELDPDRIERSLAAVGMRHLVLHPEMQAVSLHTAGMRIDLGGIAKGYALDAALTTLRKEGIDRALVDAGGDLAIGAAPRGKPGWRVGIAGLDPRQPPLLVSMLSNAAVATSGDAYQFLEIDGKRYSHILNPRTGYGVTHRGTVTVFAESATDADAWASALSILGPEGAPQVLQERPKLAAWMEFLKDDRPFTWVSPNLGGWLAEHTGDSDPAAD